MQQSKKKNARTVERKDIRDLLALTPMQEGMLFHYIQSPRSPYYFEQLDLSLSGVFEPVVFEQAWNDVVKNNPVLRTAFRWEGVKQPVQLILKEHPVEFHYVDLADLPGSQQYKRTLEIKNRDRERGFDLTDVPFRVTLCRFGAGKGCMVVSSHHIIFDGWSNGILLAEFFQAYRERRAGNVPQLPVKPEFKQFIRWALSPWDSSQEEFWRDYLSGIDEPSLLPIKNTGIIAAEEEVKQETELSRQRLMFPIDTRKKADEWAKTHRVTLAALLYGTWGILLQRYTDREDVVFGTTVSGRSAPVPGIEEMVGLMINTLPMRVRAGKQESVVETIQRLTGELRQRESFSAASLVALKEKTAIAHDVDFFDSLVVIENYPLDSRLTGDRSPGDLSIDSYRMEEMTHFDLTLGIMLFDTIDIHFLYPKGRFDDHVLHAVARHFNHIFSQILDNPSLPVNEIDMILPGEKQQILEYFNDTAAEFPKEKTIHGLFEEQAKKRPQSEALVRTRFIASTSPPKSITYEQLNQKANNLSYNLKQKGIIPGSIIALIMNRSPEMMISILGILKAGAAYLPIDPNYPQDRIDYIINDSSAALALTNASIRPIRPTCPICPIDTVIGEDSPAAGAEDRSETCPYGDRLAYVIYTSGSTGRPKGVMVEHRSVVNLLFALNKKYPLGESDTYLLKTPFLFDVSVSEILGFFINGGRLALLEPGAEKDPRKIIAAVREYKVTHINFVPSLFYAFVDHLYLYSDEIPLIESLKYIFLAGEALLPEPVQRFLQLPISSPPKLENLYGPTEATVYASGFSLEHWQEGTPIPIGGPLANMQLYILSTLGHVQPVGVPGELFIAGAGLARGYLNRPELTYETFVLAHSSWLIARREKKVKRPTGTNEPSFPTSYELPATSYLYKTGDLVRWQPDGNIEFLGRIDRQVKVRGFRIELGEIENALVSHDLVKDAVAVTGDYGDGDLYICAYVVLRTGAVSDDLETLKKDLSGSLPEYMVPSFFIILESIPLTPSGKVDRRSLPLPEAGEAGTYIAPRDEIETKLAELWKETLGLDAPGTRLSIDDNFFKLGGHSLKAARLVGRIHKTFEIQLPLDKLFNHPTIRQLRHYLATSHKEKYTLVQPVEKKDSYPLSSPQKRLFILHGADPGSVVYNMPAVMELQGQLDVERCKNAFHQLVERHESLRTSFHQRDEEPVQVVSEPPDVDLTVDIIEAQHETVDIRRVITRFVRPFELTQAPLMRVQVVKTRPGLFYLMVDMHHIISDGTSIGILIKEFMALINRETLPELPLQYKDYTLWQYRPEAVEETEKQETFWLEHLSGSLPRLELPMDFPRPAVMTFGGNSHHLEIDADTTRALNEYAREHGATLYMVLLAAFNIWLARLSGQEDIIIGTVAQGRRLIQWQSIIGFFINTMAIRHYPEGTKTVDRFLEEVKAGTLAAFQNQEYPFDRLVEKLGIPRERSGNPVFDVLFTLQNMDVPELVIPGLTLKSYPHDPMVSKFDLSLIAIEQGGKVSLTFEYNTALFLKKSIERFASYFVRLVSQIPGADQTKLCDLEILSDEEKKQLVETFNDTTVQYPKEKSIHQLFREQAQKTPDRIAAVCRETNVETVSYRYIDQQSDRLAAGLIEKGVAPGNLVVLMLERSIDAVVGLLGILKAGAAYLPIGPDYPEDRIHYMLNDSNAALVLTGNIRPIRPICPICTIDTVKGSSSPGEDLADRLGTCPYDERLAYVIYTSGSTGKPKGVMVDHHNVVRLVKNTNYMEFPEDGRLLQTASLAFDASTFENWAPLLNGLEIYLLEKNTILLPAELKQAVQRYAINILFLTTALLSQMCEADPEIFAPLKYLLTGGDVLSPVHQERVRSRFPALNFINCYGPTENGAFSTTYPITRELKTSVPIGKPIANSTTYIVDKYGRLTPIGVAGELWTGGDGVARGYLNRPELTAEKFVLAHSSWLVARREEKEKKLTGTNEPSFPASYELRATSFFYQTGDLTRWLPDGNIEFLGRIDQQVKIRGFRIEPGEIETRLLELSDVGDAVVVPLMEKSGQRYLCAYIVPVGEVGEDFPHSWIEKIKRGLSEVLPQYMIPDRWVKMDKLPLTPSGKVNRRALPEPGADASKRVTLPRNGTEREMAGIWSGILDIPVESISMDDDFFMVGGHSLKATVLVSRIHKVFGTKLTLAQMFRAPTVEGLSKMVSSAARSIYEDISPVEHSEYYPQSSAQRRLFFLDQMGKAGFGYHIGSMLYIGGRFDAGEYNRVLEKLTERHESLRTSFHMVGHRPMQKVWDARDVAVEIDYNEQERGDNESIRSFFQRPFDLSKPPLFRTGVVKTGENGYVMLFDIHHIIGDGTSMGVLIDDFNKIKARMELLPLRIQYKDFAAWQNRLTETGGFAEHIEYWQGIFPDVLEIPRVQLPYDFPRPEVFDFAGGQISSNLGPDLAGKFNALALSQGATLYMNLLAALHVLLFIYGGQEDMVVGSVFTGRPHTDLQSIPGMFVNTLPMRAHPNASISYREFLENIKVMAVDAFDHQDLPFEELVEHLNPERDPSRNPLFDVCLVVQNFQAAKQAPGEISLTRGVEAWNTGTAKFDLMIMAEEKNGDIAVTFEYASSLFKKETVERIRLHFLNVIDAVCENPGVLLGEIDVLRVEEKERLLYHFNPEPTPYPGGAAIHGLFTEQALRTPDRVAVVSSREGVETVSYRVIDRQSDCLAAGLIKQGIKPGSIVALMMERSIDVIVGLLGILKAGAAYLPIEPDYPGERTAYMLTDSNARLLLTDENFLREKFSSCPPACAVHSIDSLMTALDGDCTTDVLDTSTDHERLAYVIYTSGSTGKPKGVMVDHHNVVRLVKNTGYIQFREGGRLLQTGALSFDASTFEIWGSLLNGLELYLAKKDNIIIPAELKRLLRKFQIDIIWMTSAFFNQVCDSGPEVFEPLRYLLVGGDVLSPKHIERVRAAFPALKVINGYGPTENTTFSTTYPVTGKYKTSIPIGKPVSNSTAYVMDKCGRFVPVGVSGELWVGGEGVARGYLNRPELTAEKFVLALSSKLIARRAEKEEKLTGPNEPSFPASYELRAASFPSTSCLYKTGDLVRWRVDGNLEFIGRIDQQVKIRGFRIEPGGIAARLLELGDVGDAVVVPLFDKGGHRYLCAYVVPAGQVEEEGAHSWFEQVKHELSRMLPPYMLPDRWMKMDKLPLTPNGKVDRRALPEPGADAFKTLVPPRNANEERIVEIWSGILDLPAHSISMDDNFFMVGGHSLKATMLVSSIHKTFGVKLSLAEVFRAPTVEGLSQIVSSAARSIYEDITPLEPAEYYPQSSAQRRLFFLDQMGKAGFGYHIGSMLYIGDRFDTGEYNRVLEKLTERHESLRTSFHMVGHRPMQKVWDARDVTVEIDYNEQERGDNESIRSFFQRPFDLSKPPLFRTGVVKTGENGYVLLFDIHHIIGDGTSMGVLIDDFNKIKARMELPPLRIQYKDFAVWQNRLMEAGGFAQHIEYWKGVFPDAQEIPRVQLPYDFPRPEMFDFTGGQVDVNLGPDLAVKFNSLALSRGATLYMNLLAALHVLLFKYSGQEDMTVGSVVTGRPHADLQSIPGMFVNTLPMRAHPNASISYHEFLEEVKKMAVKAFDHQDLPFEELVEHLNPERDPSRNPLFDVCLVVQNFQAAKQAPGEISLTRGVEAWGTGTAKFDLMILVEEKDGDIAATFEYAAALLKKETAERMQRHFLNVITAVCEYPGVPVGEIDILTVEEKERLLYQFNPEPTPFPGGQTIHGLFIQQANKIPDTPALISAPQESEHAGNDTVTYGELLTNAARVARALVEKGIEPGSVVAVMMERSIEMVTALLGILMSGGAYLPIDPDYPEDRINYIINDSSTKLILTAPTPRRDRSLTCPPNHVEQLQITEALTREPIDEVEDRLETCPYGDPLAYVIYTSGSTGRPKGVMVEHRSVVNLLWALHRMYPMETGDVYLLKTPFLFDVSVSELFGWYLAGASLAVSGPGTEKDPALIVSAVQRFKATHINFVPSLFQVFVEHLHQNPGAVPVVNSLKYIFLAGEALPAGPVLRFRQLPMESPPKLENLYGPTEATVYASGYSLEHWKENQPVLIGVPMPNLQLYILSPNGKIQPVGIPGELHIAGTGLARGYLNRPELTAERFSLAHSSWLAARREEKEKKLTGPNGLSFPSSYELRAASCLYKTGDLARWLNDGNIEFLGRIDFQVKVRGFRIELGEIENCLRKYEAVKEAVVTVTTAGVDNEQHLCAYIVPQEEAGQELAVSKLREFLLMELPSYMVPSYFVEIESVPYTMSGKLDKKSLPGIGDTIDTGTDYEAPGNELEKKLVEIWAKYLSKPLEQLSVLDNFFDLGGQSLVAMRMAGELREAFGVEVPLISFFREGNIRAMARMIDRLKTEAGGQTASGENLKDHSLARTKLKKRARKKVSL